MTRLPRAFLTRPLAHRGLHDLSAGVPENSPTGFEAAIAAGYGIELDVQMSGDGCAMVFHDYDMARLTGQPGPIRQRSASDLATIPLSGGSDTIPTLPQVLDLVAGRTPLLIEIKDQDGAMGPDVGPLEQAVANALHGYSGPVGVMSYNPHSVAAFGKASPHIPRGLVTEPFPAEGWKLLNQTTRSRLAEIPDYDRVGASFISHDHADLNRPRITDLRQAGADILCWTVRSPDEEAAARKYADNITFEGYRPALLTP